MVQERKENVRYLRGLKERLDDSLQFSIFDFGFGFGFGYFGKKWLPSFQKLAKRDSTDLSTTYRPKTYWL